MRILTCHCCVPAEMVKNATLVYQTSDSQLFLRKANQSFQARTAFFRIRPRDVFTYTCTSRKLAEKIPNTKPIKISATVYGIGHPFITCRHNAKNIQKIFRKSRVHLKLAWLQYRSAVLNTAFLRAQS